MILYHNARCAKSRETLNLLKEKGYDPEVIEYMKEPLTPKELQEIVDMLGISAEELVRKKEKTWKEEYADKELIDDEIILAMIENPKLMERPILVNDGKAVVGRPPEKVLEIV